VAHAICGACCTEHSCCEVLLGCDTAASVCNMAALLTESPRAPSAAAGDKCTWHESSADGALGCFLVAQPCSLPYVSHALLLMLVTKQLRGSGVVYQ
jgi:hypothetical protein